MKRRVVLTLILVSAFAYISNAQLLKDLHKLYDPINSNSNANDSTIFTQHGIIKPGKPVYNVTFGTGYTSFGKGVGFSNSYVSPTVTCAPTEKMTVVVGASFSLTNFNNLSAMQNSPAKGQFQQSNRNPTQAFAYGQYQVNNRFSVYAIGSFAKNQLYTSPFEQGIGKADYNELGVGFNYKLSKNVTFGASFNYTNGSNFMGLSPYGNFNNTFNPLFP